jgi:hypothetical protein
MEHREHWSRPQLIVLGRGRPEESVLSGCKNFCHAGPASTRGGCFAKKQQCFSQCSGIAHS